MSVSHSTAKLMFALSGNTCAYTSCEEILARPTWPRVMGEIAHIRGERPGSARYDPSMTGDERDDFANLILLCPNHHNLIDNLEPETHPVDRLIEMKNRHDERAEDARRWSTDADLEQYATLVISFEIGTKEATGTSFRDPGDRAVYAQTATVFTAALDAAARSSPHLTVVRRGGNLILVNDSDQAAFALHVSPASVDTNIELPPISPPQLGPGEEWTFVAGRVDEPGPLDPVHLDLGWADAAGHRYSSSFAD